MKAKTLFDELYDKSEEFIKKLKKPLVKKQIKRKLCAAYDDAENNKINAEASLQDKRGEFDNFDVNKILEMAQIIDENMELQKKIANEYLQMFGEKMPKGD